MSRFALQALAPASAQRCAGKIRARALQQTAVHRGYFEPHRYPRSLRIIVADDERDTVLTLTMILKDEGHDVQGVYAGSRVLPLVREFDPDVVLLDIALPEKSGFEIAQEIRKRPRGQRVRC
jgi:PleD family two-component response regulator